MSGDHTNWKLRELLRPDTEGEEESIGKIRQRVENVIDESSFDTPRPRLKGRGSRRRVHRIVAFATLGVALLAGVAVAADQGILFSDKPDLDRLQVLKDDAPQGARIPKADAGSYSPLAWPLPEGKGDALPNDHVRILIDYSDDVRAVRILAVPTTKQRLCYATWEGEPGKPLAVRSQTCGGFRPGWPLIEGSRTTDNRLQYYSGLAADEVKQVRFITDERVEDATMGRNSYVWAPPTGARATAIEVEFTDGSAARRDLRLDGAYSEPYVTRRGVER